MQQKSKRSQKRVFIEQDMPGGNGKMLDFDEVNSTIVIRPEKKEGSPYRAWFYIRICNLIPGQTYNIKIVENSFAGVYFYCDSPDGVWKHFTEYKKENDTDYTFVLRPTANTMYIAMMPPYLQTHLDRLIVQTSGADTLSVKDFWTSEEKRPGKLFEIGNSTAACQVWITARMHAFEAASSWVADGLIRWALSDDLDAKWLIANTCLHVVPIIDIDSVQNGGTGKHRQPVCFARDACDDPHWNAITVLLDEIKRQGSPDIFLDLHCPAGNVDDTYFYAPQTSLTSPMYERELVKFFDLLSSTFPSAMHYKKRTYRCPLVPDNQGQNMAGTSYFYLHQCFFKKNELKFALGTETPWSDPAYTTDVFSECGAGYGQAISQFLQN